MADRADTHAFLGRDDVVVVALGSSASDGVPQLREKLRSVLAREGPAPGCVVIDATGAAGVDPVQLAAKVAADPPTALPLAVVSADAAADTHAGQVKTVDGVVVAPTVRQALEACREQGYTS
jgi:hypothetical protein